MIYRVNKQISLLPVLLPLPLLLLLVMLPHFHSSPSLCHSRARLLSSFTFSPPARLEFPHSTHRALPLS